MNKYAIAAEFGRRVRSFRRAENMTQAQLAELVGCHYTYVGQIERGEKTATLKTAVSFALALEIPVTELISRLDGSGDTKEINDKVPRKCYKLMLSMPVKEQNLLYEMIVRMAGGTKG